VAPRLQGATVSAIVYRMAEGKRPPTSVAVIGAGVSGMAMGLRLLEAGVPFTVFEKGSDVGGTWRENRYPGLTIDVPSPLYTFTGHRHPGWRRWMPGWQEILDYHRDVATRAGLREHIRFDTEVVAANWTGTQWEVETAAGEVECFRVLVCASGFLHHPRIPDFEGLSDFAGELVHSARWREDIVTAGRRVGVIGNGSTGVQLVTALGGVASHLTMFQRTPQWIFPLADFAMPRFLRRLLARVPVLSDLLVEGLVRFADWFVGGASVRDDWRRRLVNRLARANLRSVRDPDLRAMLTPRDEALCKRPLVSTSFYRVLERPDVDLVTSPISRLVAEGVVTEDGKTHPLDVLILATGFEAHNYMRPIAIRGEDGIELNDVWANGPYGYRTVSLSGFPNMFMLMGPHSPLNTIAIHESAELQSDYVMQMLRTLEGDGIVSVAPTTEATERWLSYIRDGMPGTVWASGCNSWYLGDGDTPVLWPYDRRAWHAALRRPELADYEIRRVVSPVGV
jgi:cation diffusion facilitator CzcD-associated flavoprotein CzcO